MSLAHLRRTSGYLPDRLANNSALGRLNRRSTRLVNDRHTTFCSCGHPHKEALIAAPHWPRKWTQAELYHLKLPFELTPRTFITKVASICHGTATLVSSFKVVDHSLGSAVALPFSARTFFNGHLAASLPHPSYASSSLSRAQGLHIYYGPDHNPLARELNLPT
jgi:hypothetical protein